MAEPFVPLKKIYSTVLILRTNTKKQWCQMDVYDKLSSLILYMYNHKLSITFVINWKNILHLKKKNPKL